MDMACHMIVSYCLRAIQLGCRSAVLGGIAGSARKARLADIPSIASLAVAATDDGCLYEFDD
jgi:hypothetical protein